MVAAYVVMGARNARKSSTIRALTGVGRRQSRWQIATARGPITAFVQVSALQEDEFTAAAFVNAASESRCSHVLLPLWLSPRRSPPFPSGADYLAHFVGVAGWTIEHIVVLGEQTAPPLPAGVPIPNLVSDSRDLSSNEIASRARGWWGWL